MKTTSFFSIGAKAAFVAVLTFALLADGDLRAAPPAVGAPQLVGPSAEALAQVDIEFSRLAGKEGAAKAFDLYLADDAVEANADDAVPLKKSKLITEMRELDATGQILVWAPYRAETADTGDFGFTYGRWEQQKKDGTVTSRGWYVTAWRRINGAWKATFDMGNQSSLEAK